MPSRQDTYAIPRCSGWFFSFRQDAVNAAAIGITLPKRNNGNAASSEPAGFSHHALDNLPAQTGKSRLPGGYLRSAGRSQTGKGNRKTRVTELVTPGGLPMINCWSITAIILALHFNEEKIGLVFLISALENFFAEGDAAYADKLLQSLNLRKWSSSATGKTFQRIIREQVFTYTLEEWILLKPMPPKVY